MAGRVYGGLDGGRGASDGGGLGRGRGGSGGGGVEGGGSVRDVVGGQGGGEARFCWGVGAWGGGGGWAKGAVDGGDDLGDVEGFADVGECAEAECFLGCAAFGIACHDDDGDVGEDLFGGGHELDAVDARHGEIGDDEVEAFAGAGDVIHCGLGV